jgi:hypothetical protein
VIDALLYAVRDGIRRLVPGYDVATCEITDDGRPPPRCGNYFAAVHGGTDDSMSDNQLQEYLDFSVTLTMRVAVPLDRVGDQQLARNIARVPLGQRQGFYAKREQLRAFLHMSWERIVLVGRVPPSANDNLAAWLTGTVYGFCEPARYRGSEKPTLVGGEWFGSEPDAEDTGIKSEIRFARARRFQPQTLPAGPFA